MGWIFGREGVNLVDGRHEPQLFAPLADGESGLFHLHALFQANGTTYLEVGEAIDFGGMEQLIDFWRLQVFYKLAGLHEFRDLSKGCLLL